MVNRIVIRRTNSILSKYLPPKVEQVVCCRLTPLQKEMYKKMLKSGDIRDALEKSDDSAALSSLSAINKVWLQIPKIYILIHPFFQLKKICNHPCLVWENAKVSFRCYICS